MSNYISEIIAGIALLFSIYTQIKQNKAKSRQEKSEKEIDNLKAEVFRKQSEINDFILEKEKSVEIHVFSRDSSSNREMVFHNIGSVNAESFNVKFKGGFRSFGDPPVLPATLFKGKEVSFKYAVSIATTGTVDAEISWINPRTGQTESEVRTVNLL